METVAAKLAALPGARDVLLARLPGLPDKGDGVDWIQARLPDWDGYDKIPVNHVDNLRVEFLEAVEDTAIPAVLAAIQSQSFEWPAPRPLPDSGYLESGDGHPIELLPAPLRDAAREVGRFAKVPVVSPALVGLSLIATALAMGSAENEN